MGLLRVGEIVPLNAELECYSGEDVFVRAFITDKDNNSLSTLDLINRGGGSFEKFDYTYDYQIF